MDYQEMVKTLVLMPQEQLEQMRLAARNFSRLSGMTIVESVEVVLQNVIDRDKDRKIKAVEEIQKLLGLL